MINFQHTEIPNKHTILGRFLLESHQGWLSISTVGKLKLNNDHLENMCFIYHLYYGLTD